MKSDKNIVILVLLLIFIVLLFINNKDNFINADNVPSSSNKYTIQGLDIELIEKLKSHYLTPKEYFNIIKNYPDTMTLYNDGLLKQYNDKKNKITNKITKNILNNIECYKKILKAIPTTMERIYNLISAPDQLTYYIQYYSNDPIISKYNSDIKIAQINRDNYKKSVGQAAYKINTVLINLENNVNTINQNFKNNLNIEIINKKIIKQSIIIQNRLNDINNAINNDLICINDNINCNQSNIDCTIPDLSQININNKSA